MTSPETVSSFASFLAYGPLGLAGLMLVLTITALAMTINPARERLLRQFMYVGSACFIIAVAANFFSVIGKYPLHFQIYPLDLGQKRILPEPIIKVNNSLIDAQRTYLVSSEATASIDVSDAMNYTNDVRMRAEQMQASLSTISQNLTPSLDRLQSIPKLLDRNCPGGSNGISANSNTAVLELTGKVSRDISSLLTNADSQANSPLPSVLPFIRP